MDQDSFRQLLSTPGAVASTSTGKQRSSLLTGKQQSKAKTINASEPAFKPRKVKKSDSKYRDRASERRGGLDNDYTGIEAVLEDFVQRNKDIEDPSAIEEKRKYLGGDSDHSILVKGLDFALLEQNKARETTAFAGDDDESLEQAFRGATTGDNSAAPTPVIETKKKTREDLIKLLKEKREKDRQVAEKEISIEEAKKAGKFRPIGFKPLESEGVEEKGTKKRKKEKDGENKRRKKKVKSESQSTPVDAPPPEQPEVDLPPPPVSRQEPEPGPDEPDFEIFADAEEYTGLQIDEDEEVEETNNKEPEPEASSAPKRNWFDEPEEPSPPLVPAPAKELVEEGEEEEQPPMRLVPLASSSVPSVRDILAMDQETQKEEKRKARKEKRKEKKELSAEGKANRDYQKLMAFEKKKEK